MEESEPLSSSSFMEESVDESDNLNDWSISDLDNCVSMENFALIKVLGRGGKNYKIYKNTLKTKKLFF